MADDKATTDERQVDGEAIRGVVASAVEKALEPLAETLTELGEAVRGLAKQPEADSAPADEKAPEADEAARTEAKAPEADAVATAWAYRSVLPEDYDPSDKTRGEVLRAAAAVAEGEELSDEEAVVRADKRLKAAPSSRGPQSRMVAAKGGGAQYTDPMTLRARERAGSTTNSRGG